MNTEQKTKLERGPFLHIAIPYDKGNELITFDDAGTYTLMDAEKNPLCQICGYVPNKLIPPFEKGFGDYIELAIKADGTVGTALRKPFCASRTFT